MVMHPEFRRVAGMDSATSHSWADSEPGELEPRKPETIATPAIPVDSPFAANAPKPSSVPAAAGAFSFSFDLKPVGTTAGTLLPVVPVVPVRDDAAAAVVATEGGKGQESSRRIMKSKRTGHNKGAALGAEEWEEGGDEQDEAGEQPPTPTQTKPLFDPSSFDLSGFAAALPATQS